MAWGTSCPLWAGQQWGERGCRPPPYGAWVEGKERRSGTPSSRGTPVSFPCGKLKARIKGFSFGNPRRVLVGLGETPSRTRRKSIYIYAGRAALNNTQVPRSPAHTCARATRRCPSAAARRRRPPPPRLLARVGSRAKVTRGGLLLHAEALPELPAAEI